MVHAMTQKPKVELGSSPTSVSYQKAHCSSSVFEHYNRTRMLTWVFWPADVEERVEFVDDGCNGVTARRWKRRLRVIALFLGLQYLIIFVFSDGSWMQRAGLQICSHRWPALDLTDGTSSEVMQADSGEEMVLGYTRSKEGIWASSTGSR